MENTQFNQISKLQDEINELYNMAYDINNRINEKMKLMKELIKRQEEQKRTCGWACPAKICPYLVQFIPCPGLILSSRDLSVPCPAEFCPATVRLEIR